MVVVDYLMGRKIKHYSLMMNLKRGFGIPNEVVLFLNHSRDKCCQKKGAMVGPCILFVATFAWIVIGQNGSSSL
jgi:hypothetical protein